MKINPKVTDKVVKVSVDIEKQSKDTASCGNVEDVVAELPRMSLETVMPKSKIGKAVKKGTKEAFDFAKAIDEFDIKDKDKIAKICEQLDKDIVAFEEKFSPKDGKEIEDAATKHQKTIKEINEKYDKFVNKISEMFASDDPEVVAEANKLFDEQVNPRILHLQQVFRRVDTRKDVSSAYKLQSLLRNIKELKSLKQASVVTFAIEQQKPELTQRDYEKASSEMAKKIEELSNNKESKSDCVSATKDTQNSVMKYSQMDVKSIRDEISKLTADDLASEKFGFINDALTHFAKTDTEKYEALSELFNSKIIELSQDI